MTSASAWICIKNKNALSSGYVSGPHRTSNFDRQSLIHSDLRNPYVLTKFCTLDSGIDVGPTFIKKFSRPYGLIREYSKVIYLDDYLLHRTCVFKALRLFPTLRLFRRLE